MKDTLFFLVSKLGWALFTPSHLLVILLLASFVVPAYEVTRAAMRAVIAILFAIMLVVPVGDWLLLPLEQCMADQSPPLHVDGIIVLGGAVSQQITEARNQPSFNGSVDRIITMMKLMKQYPDATIIYTGGSNAINLHSFQEAKIVRQLVLDLGLDDKNLLGENNARNTYENALYSQPVFARTPGQNWLLVTSAYHMPRAMALFEKAGEASDTHFFPYLTDFHTGGRFQPELIFDLASNLERVDTAAKEYVGLLVNKLLKHSDRFWPCHRQAQTVAGSIGQTP